MIVSLLHPVGAPWRNLGPLFSLQHVTWSHAVPKFWAGITQSAEKHTLVCLPLPLSHLCIICITFNFFFTVTYPLHEKYLYIHFFSIRDLFLKLCLISLKIYPISTSYTVLTQATPKVQLNRDHAGFSGQVQRIPSNSHDILTDWCVCIHIYELYSILHTGKAVDKGEYRSVLSLPFSVIYFKYANLSRDGITTVSGKKFVVMVVSKRC